MMIIKWLQTIDCNYLEIKKRWIKRLWVEINLPYEDSSQVAITCSKVTMETLEQGVKYDQSIK